MSLFQQGIQAFQAGRTEEAAACFRELVRLEPRNLSAWNALGNILAQSGDAEAAVAAYRQALALRQDVPEILYNLAGLLQARGLLADAELHYRRALALRPGWAPCLNNLGNLLWQANRIEEAAACYRQTLDTTPDDADAAGNLGLLLAQQGREAEAIPRLQQATRLRPDLASLWEALGGALLSQRRPGEATPCFQAALRLAPQTPDLWLRLARAWRDQGQPGEAVACYREAVRLQPERAGAWASLGAALLEHGDHEEAIACCKKVVELTREGNAEAHSNLGAAYEAAGRLDQAIACYRQARTVNPDYAEARLNLGLALLARGEWTDEAWEGYEARRQAIGLENPLPGVPAWQGEPLLGRRLLLWKEQGLGDTILMFRYAETLRGQGAEVVVLAAPALATLLRRGHPEVTVVTQPPPGLRFDFQCPFMGLLRPLGITPETVWPAPPYLFPRPEPRPGHFAPDRIQVGLVWAGNPGFKQDQLRSLPHFRTLAPLLALPEVQCHSLYVGPRMAELEGYDIDNPAQAFRDFDDTAACLQHLDLVVSVDTAAAHLAGALGRPAWILLPSPAEWRWYPYDTTTRWYPSAKLFIQNRQGDWDEVVGRVAQKLLTFRRP